jgi:NHL repeat-containing protein
MTMKGKARSAAALAAATAALLLAAASAGAFTPEGATIVAGNTNRQLTDYADGVPATSSLIGSPGGLAADPQGNLFFSEQGGVGRVRKVAPDGIVTGVTGPGPPIEKGGFAGDNGPASGAQFRQPGGVAVDGHGNVYVADKFNYRVRKIDAAGIITTVAGNGILLANGLGAGVSGDGGKATDAGLFGPDGLAVDRLGNLYIADGGRIRKVDTAGIITTYAGNGGIALGPSGSTVSPQDALSDPTALAIVGDDMYITEYAGVRKIHLPDGVITNVAGTWLPTALGGDRGDGGPATQATFLHPSGASADSHGNVFIADAGNRAIRQITPDGIIRTVGTMPRDVSSIIVDARDDVYYAEPHFNLIIKLGGVAVSARKVLPLPSNDTCTSHRAFPIRVRRYRGITYTSASVAINGHRIPVYVYTTRRVKVTKVGAAYLNQRRFHAFIDLRGRAKGTYKVRVTATTTTGRVLAATRTYHTCSRSGRFTGGIPRL